MWDIPEPALEPYEGKVIGFCKYCHDAIFEDEEFLHIDCDEIYGSEDE